MPGGSVGRDQLAMAAKVRQVPLVQSLQVGFVGSLGCQLYTDLIKKRKPSRDITDEGELIRDCFSD